MNENKFDCDGLNCLDCTHYDSCDFPDKLSEDARNFWLNEREFDED